MNDKGEIVDRHWKARNLKGFFGGRKELFTTTIYDVLDRYVEMYGPDAVLPVTRTPPGSSHAAIAARSRDRGAVDARDAREVLSWSDSDRLGTRALDDDTLVGLRRQRWRE